MYRTRRPPAARRRPRAAPPPIRGSSPGQAHGGIALLLSAIGDQVVVGNAVDHADPAIEMLLMYSVSDVAHPGRHWQAEPEDTDARCMLLGLGAHPDDRGADNAVVFTDAAEPAAQTPRTLARDLVTS